MEEKFLVIILKDSDGEDVKMVYRLDEQKFRESFIDGIDFDIEFRDQIDTNTATFARMSKRELDALPEY